MGLEREWRASKGTGAKPYRQGDLDGLCGLYAIINALRRATRREPLEEDAWPWLFAELLRKADRSLGAVHAVTCGIDTKPLWRLAKYAVGVLAAEYDLGARVTRPLKGKRKLTVPKVVDAVANVLARDDTGVLVGFGGPLDHWTVVTSVSPLHLSLFDSSGRSRVRQDRCALASKRDQPGLHILQPAAIFAFSLR
ncbi:hypothetical protein [Methylopila sp. M107]|uniref:hypothetical protein n=1 Tax=Methylopila sp. M107 TaxID=1101190 RepID=UPI00058BC9FE|nr:hypothetical protein [Methylopila sp. M107]